MSTTSNRQEFQDPRFAKPAAQQPGYVEQASNLLSSVATTASAYLPTNVTNAVAGVAGPGNTITGVGGHPGVHGGVGDLGTQSTDDVVRLPEERQHPDPLGSSFSATTGTGISGVGGHPGHPGGVGDLGTTSTADVAVLPEERVNPNPLANTTSMGSAMAGTFGVAGHPGSHGGVGDLGTSSDTNVAVLPHEHSQSNTTGPTRAEDAAMAAGGLGGHDGRHHDITKEGSTGGRTGANYDLDHSLGMPHTRSMAPNNTNGDDPTSTTAQSHREESHQEDHGGVDRQGSSGDADVPSPKEAGFPTGKPKMMDKIKGSIMVATAKVGGGKDDEKIHQGKMLKETGKLVNPEEEARRARSL
ncbi:hypothetical protein FRB94_002391 [Tulasnella sp. JGI-2019a]|nr:hypothetical protein FRB94_002391 [Tulasnella sp. JGI-2019a]